MLTRSHKRLTFVAYTEVGVRVHHARVCTQRQAAIRYLDFNMCYRAINSACVYRQRARTGHETLMHIF